MVKDNGLLNGLTKEQVDKNIKEFGKNIIKENKKTSAFSILFSQFNDIMIWILIVATIISGIIGDVADSIVIVVIIVINAILGFFQEFRTEKSLESLKKLSSPTTKVIRDGSLKIMDAVELTIGDLILLESGDRIPADAKIIKGELTVDESLLTGESVGVNKSSDNKEDSIFMGTIVLKGKAYAKIINIGMNTEMGKIANMLQNIDEDKSPLKERLEGLGKVLVVICILICAVVTVIGIARGQSITDMFLIGVSLAVAAIPEGLPAIVTVALALGVSKMLKRHALIRKLPSVETLGCTSIICSDKTGTLTENKMSVREVYFDGKIYEKREDNVDKNEILKKIFVLCNDFNINKSEKNFKDQIIADPTEKALIEYYFDDVEKLDKYYNSFRKLSEIPFDSDRKMASVVMKDIKSSENILLAKGAPEKMLANSKYYLHKGNIVELTSFKKQEIIKEVEMMSLKGLRCLGAGFKKNDLNNKSNLEKDLVFVGFCSIIDPPRRDSKDAVIKCKQAGITTIMITGDHKNTAFAIAKELQICTGIHEVLTGNDIEKMSDKSLGKAIDSIKVFARVTPKHKLRIVQAFKAKGNVVAMTGDGVNDAPAIKEADIGISMGISGTDVTKEASAMILMDDNFSTIVSAVEEGRKIYLNIRKFIRYLLSCNIGEVLTMFLASIFSLPNPLTPIQILFVNLATDGLPALALGVDNSHDDIMNQPPRPRNESIFSRGLWEKILFRGTLIGISTIFTFIIGLYLGFSVRTCRTMTLATLVLSQLIHVFECKSETRTLFQINLLTNKYLLISVFISVIMILGIIYIPFFQSIFKTSGINLVQWGIVLLFSGVISVSSSLFNLIKRKK
ncbi:calcium-translocating P-type ATPase, PMCA-type [Candidatus Arthromitus sp. SFB-rat-Yit]|uniref:calcium-translocating P-type ATPase, PMCA-type n=1 Tax=Candidatus Arthromitus sp. SFB-rat-Yit TaxID=1041504 RepID=UPI000227A657|nr:putative calcium-translocating P-type ATPase, PMCA-type [Candidatus Arthromitus sp. SFB-rat-Yit]